MRDAALIQQSWPGGAYEKMMELNKDRNKAYCEAHDFDYEYLVGASGKYGNLEDGSWMKVEMIRQALEKGYKYVVSLEPDTLIVDTKADLRDGCPNGIGACFHRGFLIGSTYFVTPIKPQWCVGAVYLQNTPETRTFVDEWLAGFPGDKSWRDNGAYNDVGMKSRTAHTISDKWNATLNVNMVPDAVVIGFHGNATSEERYELMRQTLERLNHA